MDWNNIQYIAHRRNKISQLKETPHEFGVEIDIRDRAERLVLEHDPFTDGEDLEPYLAAYKHATLILNIKSERVEHRVLELLNKYSLTNYFFLDSSFPMLYKLSGMGETRLAVRFSEFEGLDTVLAMKGRVEWVWVDCFTKLPIDQAIFKTLKESGFKLCLVSPELQGRAEDIPNYKQQLEERGVQMDAICTKLYNIPLWKG